MSSYPVQPTDDQLPQPIAPVRVSPGAKLVAGGVDSKGRPMLTTAPDGSMDYATIGKRAKQIKPEYQDMDDATLGQKLASKHPDFAQMLMKGTEIPTAVSQNPAVAGHLQSPAPQTPGNGPAPAQGPSGVPTDATGMPTPPPDSAIEAELAKHVARQKANQMIANSPLGKLLPEGTAKDVLEGMAQSGGRIATGTASLLHKIIPIKALDVTPAEQATTQPTNTTQKVSGIATDVATALLPGAAATKIARAAELAPAAQTALRLLLNSGGSGLWNKIEGGDFKTGAALGAGGEIASSGASALAPKLLRSVLPGVDSPTAATMLKNTSGMTPGAIASSAEDNAAKIVNSIHDTVGATKTPVATSAAAKIVDDALKSAVKGNDVEAVKHLRKVRDAVLNTSVPGQQANASEALGIRNTLRKLADKLPSDPESVHGPAEVASKAQAALETSIDKSVPGTQKMMETVTALLKGGKSASKAANANPSLLKTFATHHLADLLVGGTAYAGTHSPALSLGAAALTHAATSQPARVAAARAGASALTPHMLNTIKAMLMTGSTPAQYPEQQQ